MSGTKASGMTAEAFEHCALSMAHNALNAALADGQAAYGARTMDVLRAVNQVIVAARDGQWETAAVQVKRGADADSARCGK